MPDLSPHQSAVADRGRDRITISFGSHPKEFEFSVARIDLQGEHCAIFSESEGDRHRMDSYVAALSTAHPVSFLSGRSFAQHLRLWC
jgi:hypothetical protein